MKGVEPYCIENQYDGDATALFVLGALEGERSRALATHLAACPVCRAEVAGFDRIREDLSLLWAATPPPKLRARLLKEVQMTQPEVLVRANAERWQRTPFPGIRIQNLYTSPTGDVTSL